MTNFPQFEKFQAPQPGFQFDKLQVAHNFRLAPTPASNTKAGCSTIAYSDRVKNVLEQSSENM